MSFIQINIEYPNRSLSVTSLDSNHAPMVCRRGNIPPSVVDAAVEAFDKIKAAGTVKRDPDSLKNLSIMVKACFDDFKMQPKEVLAELNVKALSEVAISPADCYRQIAATRQ